MTVVVTSVRKERNVKNCIAVDFFPIGSSSSKCFPHCVMTCVRKEGGGSRVINKDFQFPHTNLQMFW